LLSLRGEPLFVADWLRVLMLHYEVDPLALQKVTPFELDLFRGRAFVTLVAFTIHSMRPRFGGRSAAWLLRPIATHHFLNVRTYVQCQHEHAIHFMAEWLSNRLSVLLGPHFFGLPYHYGYLNYQYSLETGRLAGSVTGSRNRGALAYRASFDQESAFSECLPGSLCEWLMERYTAFTSSGGKRRFFRVWHRPWRQLALDVHVTDKSLVELRWPFLSDSSLIGSNLSPGLTDVWMGWPHALTKLRSFAKNAADNHSSASGAAKAWET
jgi:uncharacterized protein YqjF (DUF2071 family)